VALSDEKRTAIELYIKANPSATRRHVADKYSVSTHTVQRIVQSIGKQELAKRNKTKQKQTTKRIAEQSNFDVSDEQINAKIEILKQTRIIRSLAMLEVGALIPKEGLPKHINYETISKLKRGCPSAENIKLLKQAMDIIARSKDIEFDILAIPLSSNQHNVNIDAQVDVQADILQRAIQIVSNLDIDKLGDRID